jgi:mRNA-degrading endonuclease RelE of RelBE toxin-antitoxin system
MSDHCAVFYLPPADRQMKKLAKQDPKRFAIVDGRIQQVEEDGWILSTRSELVKVLRNDLCIGEIRDLGSGGYRLFFFWQDLPEVKELYVTHVLPKRDVDAKARLNEVIAAVAKVRERFLAEG